MKEDRPSLNDVELRETSDGLVMEVQVQPGASSTEIADIREGRLRIRCTAPPEGGKANLQCVKLLAKRLGIAPSGVAVMRGQSSRFKSVLLRGLSAAEVKKRLQQEK